MANNKLPGWVYDDEFDFIEYPPTENPILDLIPDCFFTNKTETELPSEDFKPPKYIFESQFIKLSQDGKTTCPLWFLVIQGGCLYFAKTSRVVI